MPDVLEPAPGGQGEARQAGSAPRRASGIHRLYLGGLVVFTAAILWLRPLPTSLWLDETVTWWMVEAGFDETLRRGAEYSGGNPFYYVVVWASVQLFGKSEIALRLPSLLAMAGAALLLVLLGRRLFDTETGLLAALVFVGHEDVQFEARNARVYALGLLLVVASTLALIRWCERWRFRDGLLYAFLAALVFYVHYLFAGLYVVHGLYVVLRGRRAGRFPWARVAGVAALAALFLAPSLPWLFDLVNRHRSLLVVPPPRINQLFRVLVPSPLGTALLLGGFVAGFFGMWLDPTRPRMERRLLLSMVGWFLIPPLFMYFVSKRSPISLFIPRYFIFYTPGLALLIAWACRAIGPPRARMVLAGFLAVVAIIAYTTRRHHSNDWEGISATARTQIQKHGPMPILAHTGLVEARDPAWLVDPDKSAYLNAPFSFYEVPAPVIALPLRLHDEGSIPYLEQRLAEILPVHDRLMLVTRDVTEPGFWPWLEARLAPLGYRTRRLPGLTGNLAIILYSK